MLMVREMEALRSVNASGIRSADKRISSTAASDGVKGSSGGIGGRLRVRFGKDGEERAPEPARERKVTHDLLEPLAGPVLLSQEGHMPGKKLQALAAVMARHARRRSHRPGQVHPELVQDVCPRQDLRLSHVSTNSIP